MDSPIPVVKEDIINKLQEELPGIFADLPVMMAYLFGSVVDDYARPSSDVDIALVLSHNYESSAYECMLMEFDIALQIEKNCGIGQADVRTINQAPLTVQGSILTEGVLLFSRDEVFRVDYEVYTRTRYFDFQPVEEMMRNAFIQQIREDDPGYCEP